MVTAADTGGSGGAGSHPVDSLRYNAAAARFVAFFEELAENFVERKDVLHQIALALLCREHALLTGPPGTAKSQLAAAVFGRIFDEETGRPSFYARQFTESTVQTDLVGPIDFKTLMETGRTEHFTDEGMLGAVHAFLDEVFDGRDNLLRAALNVLQERELKQGTRVTRGRIECALMTTNRYISDVLEGSRETLLAFVDRIAFVSFVPRAFAEPENLAAVLRRQVGGEQTRGLTAPLSIQDLDVLQAATDSVEVPDDICDALAKLLAMLDGELNAAVRADPTFVPTRYLSTRTAVRSGRVLRAACVHRKLFEEPDRELCARMEDMQALRLHLLLSGPTPDHASQLLKRESDAHERRQLGILKTEREIFDRSWGKMLAAAKPSKGARKRKKGDSSDEAVPSSRTTQTAAATARVQQASSALEVALAQRRIPAAVEMLRSLALLARSSQPEGKLAATALRDGVARLTGSAFGSVLSAGDEPLRTARRVAEDVAELATAVEGGVRETTALARWLRGRALALLEDAVTHAPGATVTDLEAAAGLAGEGAQPGVDRRLDELAVLTALRRRLLSEGATVASREESDAIWTRAVISAEDELCVLWDESFRLCVAGALSESSPERIGEVLARLAPEFERLDRMAVRISELTGQPSTLKARVVGPRLGALVGAIVERLDTADRRAFLSEVDGLLQVLARADLSRAIAPRYWLMWTAWALHRSDATTPPPAPLRPDLEGYRRLRAAERRVPNSYTLAEVACRVAPPASTGEGLSSIAAVLSEIPEPLRGAVVRGDLARIDRAVRHLETWWQALAEGGSGRPEERLEVLVRSRFFRVLLDEQAPERFAMEARLIADLFPDHLEAVTELRGRLDSMLVRAREVAFELLRRRSDAAWNATLGRSGSSAG